MEAPKEPEPTEKRLTIRLPRDVYTRLDDVAEEELRSLNAQIVVLLTEALELRSRRNGPRSTRQRGVAFGRMPRRR